MRALNIVNLKCNKIGNMTEQAFNNTPALIDINLACNQVKIIKSWIWLIFLIESLDKINFIGIQEEL